MFVKRARKPLRPPRARPRKEPSQARGHARVAALLDAAAEVFDEVGYESATTAAIAARAGAPIGSLYQFFPSKLALFHGLAARCRDEAREHFRSLLVPEVRTLPLDQLVPGLVDAIAALHAKPGYRSVAAGRYLSPELIDGAAALHQDFEDQVIALMADRSPKVPVGEAREVARALVYVVDAVMDLATRSPPDISRSLIEQLKVMILRYVEPLEAANR